MRSRKIKKEGFMKGVVILMLSQLLIKILGLVYRMYITNREGFGDKGNAIYSSGFQIYALLLTVSSIGVPNAISKLVSERVAIGDHKGAYKIFRLGIVVFGFIGFCCSMFLYLGAYTISNYWLQIPEAELSLVALSPSIFFVSIISVIKGYFNGRECVKVTAKIQTVEQIFKTLLTIIVVEIIAMLTGMDTSVMAAGANLATTLSAILCFAYLYLYYTSVKRDIAIEIKNTVNYKYKGIIKTIKEIFSVSIPMSLTPILGTINKNIDSMTVVRGLKNFMIESAAKAEYGILSGKVDTLVSLPMSFNIAFMTALVPAISSAKAKGEFEGVKKRIEFSLLITILIGLPCMIGLIIFAKPILELLFPKQVSGSFILQVSATSILFIIMEQTISGILHGIGKPLVPAIALLVGVIIKGILNIILVPLNPKKFIFGGTAGAALSTTICHIISFIIQMYVIKKSINLRLNLKNYVIKPLVATVIMAICSIFIYNYFISILSRKMCTIIAIIGACIVYILCILILKVFSKQSMFMLPYGKKIYKLVEIFGIYRS